MLVLSRQFGETVDVEAFDQLGNPLGTMKIAIIGIGHKNIRLGFDGDRSVFQVTRSELKNNGGIGRDT